VTHPSTATARAGITATTEVDVSIRMPWTLLRDVGRRWPGMTLDEKVSNALMLACAWHDHEAAEDAENGDRS
jgi:hypothetical protein